MEYASGGPRLRHIGTQVLHRERLRFFCDASVKLREPIEREITGRFTDVSRDSGCLLRESVTPETHGNDAIIVWPDGAILIGERVECRVLFRKSSNTPTAPHIGFEESRDDASGVLPTRDPTPKKVPRIGRNGSHLLLVTIQCISVKTRLFAPEFLLESLSQFGGLLT